MATAQSNTLSLLSTELRLEIYRYLLTDCLATGRATDMKGLYLSCGAIRDELEEMITTVAPVLKIKHAWDIGSSTDVVLPFDIPLDWNYTAVLTNFTVSIPIGPRWNMYVKLQDQVEPEVPINLHKRVKLELQFEASVLTIKLDNVIGHDLHLDDEDLYKFFVDLLLAHGLNDLFGAIKASKSFVRLVLQLNPVIARTLMPKYHMDGQVGAVSQLRYLSDAKRYWCNVSVDAGMETWCIGFDFKSGMEVYAQGIELMEDGGWFIEACRSMC